MREKPNVVWINLDSIRADHTSMDGYHRDTTPNLERIGSSPGGQKFKNCFSHANWSLPSVASMMTGTYPGYHGTGSNNQVLPQELKTVPEILSECGYYTAGLSLNGYVNSTTGLDRGFDRFEWLSKSNLIRGAGPRITLRYLLNIRNHSAGLSLFPTQKHSTEFLAKEVAKRWLKQISRRKNEPFFFFAHTQAAHLPYYPPGPYQDEYVDELGTSKSKALETAFEKSNNYLEETARGCNYDEEVWDAIEAMYDAKIRYTDEQIGEVFDYAHSLFEDVVFVITADHGDLLGEYGILGHLFSLHDGLIRVPLVVHGLDSLGDPDQIIQHIDLVETLTSLAGGSTEQFQGIDPTKESREYALAQRGLEDYKRLEKVREYEPEYEFPLNHSTVLNCIRSRNHKYLKSEDGSDLFELPDETSDVSGEYPETAREMDTSLEDILADVGEPLESSEKRNTTRAIEKQLSDLGYMN